LSSLAFLLEAFSSAARFAANKGHARIRKTQFEMKTIHASVKV
jgi:hypothetical protein